MTDQRRTKAQLVEEVTSLRQRLAERETAAGDEYLEGDQQLRALIDSLPVFISYLGADQRYRLTNKAHCEWLGLSVGEAKGRHVSEVLGEEVYREIQPHIERALSGQPTSYETVVRRSDGAARHMSVAYAPDLTEQGHVRGFFSVSTDITARKLAEQTLAESHTHLERRVRERTVELERLNDSLRAEMAKRRLVEASLRSSQHGYRTLFESVIDGMAVVDAQTLRIVLANDRMTEMSGFESADDLCGVELLDYLDAEDRDRAVKIIAEDVFQADLRQVNEFRIHTRDGRELWVEAVGARIEYRGRPAGLCSFRDITARKAAEEALRESEERYRTLLETSAAPIYWVEVPEGTITYVNRKAEEMFARDKEDLLGRRLFEFVPEDEVALHREKMDEAARDMRVEPQPIPQTIIRPNGEARQTEVYPNMFRSGAKVVAQVVCADITERKRAEQALRASEAKYRALVDGMLDGYVVVRGGRILFANKLIAGRLGVSPEALAGASFLPLLTPESREGSQEIYESTKRGEAPPDLVEMELVGRDGATVPVEVRIREIEYEGQRAYSVVLRDIAERKRAEQRLRALQRRLRSLASQLAVVEERERKGLAEQVHDRIGQPLAMLKIKLGGLWEALGDAGLEEQYGELRQLLDQAVADTRLVTSELSPPVLYQLGLEAALEWLADRVEERYGLPCQFEDDGRSKPLGDDARALLFRAAQELLANVVKHAQARQAKVSACRHQSEIQVTVEDDGIGFDASEGEKSSSFGLFSIEQRLVEMGGRMEIQSKPGKGTQVTLAVPLEDTD